MRSSGVRQPHPLLIADPYVGGRCGPTRKAYATAAERARTRAIPIIERLAVPGAGCIGGLYMKQLQR